VTFPSEAGEGTTKYEFAYDVLALRSPGVLSKAVLPTGGWFRWHWDTWEKPQESAGSIQFAESTGVVKREAWVPSDDGTGTKVGEWTYESTLDAPLIDEAVHAVLTTIRDPLQQSTVHYFAARVRDGTLDGVSYKAEYYGLPFTQYHQSGGRYLSQVVYPKGVTPDYDNPLQGAIRATYLLYEGDGPAAPETVEKNWRMKQKREMIFLAANETEWIDTDNSSPDDYGRYGTTKTSGSFGTASRTTTTSFLAPGTNWVLGRYDRVTTTAANGDASVTDFYFEPDGFLKRARKRRTANAPSSKDLLTVYDDTDDDGMVDEERHYGGDAENKALPDNYQINGTADPAEVSYALSLTNTNGVRVKAQTDGMTFKALDLDVDLTGLPRTSSDVSGTHTTTFDYNLRGQLKSVKPGTDAWTEYKYTTTPSSFPPATVTVKQWPVTITNPSATDTPLTEARYYYDSFGRLIQERTWLSTAASSAWSVVTHQYDALGRKVSTTVPVGRASGTYGSVSQVTATRTDYDELGRAVKVTQPDDTYTDAAYTGASTIERTASTKTETGDQRVTTKETYDALGRLVTITEDSGGANDVTVYTYDEGDRLASVTQGTQASRQFFHDAAGLLTSETHPESGTTSYSYDARGNVIKKVTPTASVSTSYDAAGRVVAVAQDVVNAAAQTDQLLLQNFTYGTSGTSNGRLQTAVRHNHHAALGGDVKVTETLTYDSAGRVATKTTSITNGPTFTDKYTYDSLGARTTVEYPGCTNCGTLTPPARTVANVYAAGLLTEVTGYTNGISYHPNGLLATLKRRNANGSDGPTLTQAIDAANRMARPASTTITRHCDFEITEQPASKTVAAGEPANLTVTAPGATTFEWYVLGSTTKIANQTTSTLTQAVSETTQFWVRVGNGTCTVDSGIAMVFVQSCAAPGSGISAPANLGPSSEATATVAGTGTYSWTIEPGTGTILSGQNAQTVTFRSSCAGAVSLSVQVTAACGTSASGTKSVPIATPSVTVSASPSTIVQGQSTILSVSIAGGPWSITWSDGYVQSGVTGSASRPALSPSQTTTYSVTSINGCSGAYGSKTIFVAPPAPVATSASRSSGGIQVTWTMPQGASTDSFLVERCASACTNAASAWLTSGNTTSASYLDAAVTSAQAYVYRVKAVKAGIASAPGPLDLATNLAFSDDPVAAGVTPILLAHLSELRGAVNAVRNVAGLAPASFTDILEPGLAVRSVHFTELRSALNAARSQLGFGPVTFDPPLAVGESIRAAHVNQLRGGVR
jgi:YD repeat-containing protein